ncbi:ribosomal protein L1 [Choiromyces venosus 120613-1]|uniref:Ribosomal protein L1 n=1 Tax=Choiromyces venosus 120613-1 TaxID=1336337 RepID=A0A3N4JPD6_9PEZI|nr:ribosomal protein L1 [Choiromyces venosus 120613-1]
MRDKKAVAKPPVGEKEKAVAPTSNPPYQLDNAQVLKACKALSKWVNEKKTESSKSKKANLLEDPENPTPETVWLNLTTKKLVTDTKRLKPARIVLPHPLRNPQTTSICLIVKDPQRTHKDIIAATPALSAVVKKVVGVSKLRAKFKSFESRRLLAASYDLFLADERVVCMLPSILGKSFYGRSTKIPIPLSVSQEEGKKNLVSEVESCLKATYLHLNAAASSSVRVGLSNFTPEMVSENVAAVVQKVVEGGKGVGKKVGVPSGWKGLRSLHLKTPESAALPLWLAEELYEGGDVLKAGEREELAAKEALRKDKVKERRKKRKMKKRQAMVSKRQE